MDRSTYRYRSVADPQTAVHMRLRELATVRVRYGYRRLHVLLKREGWKLNHKRVFRVYQAEGLSLRLKRSKKRTSGLRGPRPVPTAPNQHGSMDFMSDQLADGRRIRVLTFVDTFSRVSPGIRVDSRLSGHQVVAVLEQIAKFHGAPKTIFVDNGPEFVAKALDAWAHRNQVKLAFSRPGTPTDNPCIEAFNGRLREECLNLHWFESIDEARTVIEAWQHDCNHHRPHGALDNQTPLAFQAQWLQNRCAPKAEPG